VGVEEPRPYRVKEEVEGPRPSLEEEGAEALLPSQVTEEAEVPRPCLEEEGVEVPHPYPGEEEVEVRHPHLEEEGAEALLPSQVKEEAEVPHPCLEEEEAEAPHPCLEEEEAEAPHPYLEEVVEALEVEELHNFLVLLSPSEVEERLVSRTENWYLVQVMEGVEVGAVEAGHGLILPDSPLLDNCHLMIFQGVVSVSVPVLVPGLHWIR